MNYSVLMSVYCRESPEHLRESMDSMWNQTVPTDDFVLVCDGPLGDGLNDLIAEMERSHPDTLHIFRLKSNQGLGKALNFGIKQCKNELVARMDSDDISRPERCEKQLEVFSSHPEISISSGTVEEFSESIDEIEARRVLPETQDEIIEFAKYRNPFNHPCIMYKKSAVEASGGYQDFYLLEDYYLWIRMLLNGVQGYNVQEPLLWMRAGSEMYRRRSGAKYATSQKALFKYMRDNGFINDIQYEMRVLIRSISSIAPNWLRIQLFKNVLRK